MKSNVGILKSICVDKEVFYNTKGQPCQVISLVDDNSNYIMVKFINSGIEKRITKQCALTWYRNGEVAPTSEKRKIFNSYWMDDCKNKDVVTYARWLKLKEKVLIHTGISNFNDDPHSYIEPDWLVYSKFHKWLTSQVAWESLQIRGEMVLGKKVFDIDSVVMARYNRKPKKISSESIERSEMKQLLGTKKWLQSATKYHLDTISDSDKIVYVLSYKDVVLYIGSGNKSRPNAHLSGNSHNKIINDLIFRGVDISCDIVYHTDEEIFARKEELDLIKSVKPLLNYAGIGRAYSDKVTETFLATIV